MDNSLFANRLTKERNKNNLTQQELANKIGVSQGLISQYEQGLSLPGLEIFIKFTQALECSPDYLLQDYTEVEENFDDYVELINTAIKTPRKNIKTAQELLNQLTKF